MEIMPDGNMDCVKQGFGSSDMDKYFSLLLKCFDARHHANIMKIMQWSLLTEKRKCTYKYIYIYIS